MRYALALFSFSLLFALLTVGTGCGGDAKQAKSASFAQRGLVGGMPAKKNEPDTDHDGILDKDDEAPREEVDTKAKAPEPTTTDKPSPVTTPAQSTTPAAPEPARDPSLVIYTARVTMAVYQVDQGVAAVEKIAHDMGGFLARKGDREITIRVPRARFEAAVASVDKIGDVLHRDIQAQDVTDEYVDLEIRIKNSRAMQVRLKQLLEKAAVKEALEIEKELHRVTEELERMEGKLKVLKDKIAFSTITVVFEPRTGALQASRVRLPFPWLAGLGLPNLLSLSEAK